MASDDDILDAEQVADLLQLNLDYVRTLARTGILPAHRLPGGRVYRFLGAKCWTGCAPNLAADTAGPSASLHAASLIQTISE